MKRFFVKNNLIVDQNAKIDGTEHNHIKNVLRCQLGDDIILVNGSEYDYYARIINMTKGETIVSVYDQKLNENNPQADVTVFQALVKSDNMSLIVQKLTELGVRTFVPFESEFITSKDKFGKTNKLQEISNQSIKQCKRSMPMEVRDTISFDKLVLSLKDYDIIIFANECETKTKLSQLSITKGQKVAIIIGSEGGFSDSEINRIISNGGNSVTLGKRILRAETGAIALTSVIMFLIGEWENE